MASTPHLTRLKISTTVSPLTLAYLNDLIGKGEARNLAEALDLAMERLRVHENRERLANDTAAYYSGMTEEEASEERRLEAALSQSGREIDFDR